jgi:hypothetical protein
MNLKPKLDQPVWEMDGPEFEPNPLLLAPQRGHPETQIERLKEQLLAPILISVESASLIQEIRWVANEAAALAWCSVCPVLVFPALLGEKVRASLRWWERQCQMRGPRSQPVRSLPLNHELA